MTCISRPREDQHEFALVIRYLVRLRHRQGASATERALKEAARLDWRFCANCGTEEPCEGNLCTGCGCNGNGRLGHARREDSIDCGRVGAEV